MDRQYRRKGHTMGTAICILLCLLLGVFLLCSSKPGQGIADKWIAPVAEKIMNYLMPTPIPSAAQVMIQNTPESTMPTGTPEIRVLEWELPESSWYLLEMGVFSDETAAQAQAEYLRGMGAAGYLYTDKEGYIRLLAAGYRDQESLIKVQKQITENGFSGSPYNFHLSGLKCKLTGEDQELLQLKKALQLAADIPGLLTDYALRFDREALSVDTARAQCNDWLEDILSAETTLSRHTAEAPLAAFCTYLGRIRSTLSTFLEKDATINNTQCAAALKYTQIAVLTAYKTLTEGLTS